MIGKNTGLVKGIAPRVIVVYATTLKNAIITGNGVNFLVKVGPNYYTAGGNS